MKQVQVRAYSLLAPAFLLASQLFFISPIELYLKNSEEVTVGLAELCLSLLPVFLVGWIILCLPYALPVAKFRQGYKYVISVLAILIWINATFLFGEYGELDGRGLNIEQFSLLSLMQLTVCCLIAATVIMSKKARDLLGNMVTVILCILSLTLVFNIGKYVEAGGLDKKLVSQPSFHKSLLEFSPEKNIIHIILDEFQTDIMVEILDEDAPWEKAFRGFHFFENTASVYPTTIMAVPSMLSGRVYRNEMDKELFLDEVFEKNEFLQSLEDHNYRRDFHTVYVYCGKNRLLNCSPHFSGAVGTLKYELIDIALFKSVPDLIKPYIYNDERWLMRSHFSEDKYLKTPGGIAYLLWRKYISEINNESEQPTYKFFHSGITHSPMVLDEDCKIHDARPATLEDFKQQGICALRQVVGFLQRLKELGVYENSFIIISSDHGSSYVAEGFGEKFKGRGINVQHYARSRALLMIKPTGSKEGFVRTRRPASLLDIPNTILENNNIGSIDGGVNVFTLSEDAERKRQYIYYDWAHEYWGKPTLPPLKIYEIDGPIDDPDSWSLDHAKVDPARR